jgi:hypothetical protein
VASAPGAFCGIGSWEAFRVRVWGLHGRGERCRRVLMFAILRRLRCESKLTVAPLPSTEEEGEDGIRGRARYERAKDSELLQGTGCADRSALASTP